MMSEQERICTSCNAPLAGPWKTYALVPSDDVPLAGSRTEVLVTPADSLRVRATTCNQCGAVILLQASTIQS